MQLVENKVVQGEGVGSLASSKHPATTHLFLIVDQPPSFT
jgi:hypothetical protein